MTLTALIVTVSVLTGLLWVGLLLWDVIANDGQGCHHSTRTPPRSHRPDEFEPRRAA